MIANGTNTVSVTVTGSTSGAITVSTNKGLFSNGEKAVQAPTTPVTFTLVTCNAATEANCPGTAVLRAVDASGLAGQADVTFTSSGGGIVCTTCGAAACVGVICDSSGHTCSSSSPSTCSACPAGDVEICNDGIDNNCNALVDCADPQCQPVGNDPGAFCDLVGHTCSVNNAPGPSACTTCSGNGGTPEAQETSCGDGFDNDCNGLTDCQDPACAGAPCKFGLTCHPTAKTCTVLTPTCTTCGDPACAGMTCDPLGHTCSASSPSTCTTCPGGSVEICNDGIDNNCNGLVDCEETSCQPVGNNYGAICSPTGLTCSVDLPAAASTCKVCNGNGSSPEVHETTCGDGIDNDCNGLTDCQDPNCAGSTCAFGLACDPVLRTCTVATPTCATCGPSACVGVTCDTAGHTCSASSPSTCSTCPGGAVEICNDGIDNNCNGLVDCAEANCWPTANNPGAFCDATGHTCSVNNSPGPSTCTTCSGNGGAVEAREVSCGDGVDNDCNGLADCQDPACAGTSAPCAFGLKCDPVAKTCSDPSTTCTTCGPVPCVGMTCDALGHACSVGAPSTCTTCPGGEVEICNDGIDNNCNGLIDCDETSCQPVGNNYGAICSPKGLTCSVDLPAAASACNVCNGNGGSPEASETSCTDGFDNDCDGLIDCQDPNCAGRTCKFGFNCDGAARTCTVPTTTCATCGPAACYGVTCDTDGHTCTTPAAGSASTCSDCPGGAVEICNDGVDNNCNGLVDCAEGNCQPTANNFGAVCDPVGNTCAVDIPPGSSTCRTCSGNGGTVETTEVSCGDGADNDCNGLADCQDPACAGSSAPCAFGLKCDPVGRTCTVPSTTCSACGPAPCVGMICDDVGRVCSVDAVSTCTTCPAGTIPCADPVKFSLVLAVLPPDSNRIPADGIATTRITATLTFDGQPLVGQPITFAIAPGDPGTLLPPLGVVTDSNGQLTIEFLSSALGGDATVTGTFEVNPSTPITGTTVIATPHLGRVTFVSAQYEVLGAFQSGFQERSILTYQLFDSANVPYPPRLTVTFTHQSLAGSYIGTSYAANCVADACTATAKTDINGQVTVGVSSGTSAGEIFINAGASAGGISKNADAHKLAIVGAKANGAHITMDCYLGDGTTSPADAAAGVKNIPAFSASDCNFSHYVDPSGKVVTCKALLADRFNNVIGRETRVQFFSEAGTAGPSTLTPPYDTSAAPSAQRDLGIGVSYVRPDGKLPVDVSQFGGEFFATYADGCNGRIHNPRDGLVTVIAIASGDEGFVDLNGNGVYDPLHCAGTGTGTGVPIVPCSIDADCGGVVGSSCSEPGEPFVDMGEPYIDANDNGVWDLGEFFVDVDGDGTWTPPNGKWTDNTVIWVETRVLFSGLPLNRATGGTSGFTAAGFFDPASFAPVGSFSVGTGTPGTSQSFVFAIGDGNYNPPPGGAAFAASMTGANASATFALNPTSANDLGMTFTQQYCTVRTLEEVSSPSTMCSNVCPGGSMTNPCYVVTNVGNCTPGTSPRTGCTGFGFGSIGQVTVTGGTPAGANTLQVTGTASSGSATGSLPGTVTP